MQIRSFKKQVYEELADLTKALGHPLRLEILELLAQGPAFVEYISEQTGSSIASTSQHLQNLKKVRLVRAEKRGKYSYYYLAGKQVFSAWKGLRDLGFTLNSEIRQLMQDLHEQPSALEPVNAKELRERIRNRETLLLDVRPRQEFDAGHIADAASIPVAELNDHLDKLPRDRKIIAYCRGPLCAMSDDAVRILRDHGFDAARMDIGYPEWQSYDLPVE